MVTWKTPVRSDEVMGALCTALSEELLASLPEEALSRFVQGAREHSYRKGEPIFHQDDVPGDIYVVRSGHVKHVITSATGDEFTHHLSRPGHFFGNLIGDRYGGTAVALTDCRLFVFERREFLDLLCSPGSNVNLPHLLHLYREWTQAGRRLETIHRLVFQTVPMRLANLLLDLGETSGESSEIHVPEYFNQGELAHLIGTTRESVNQCLKHFASRGWICMIGRRILILDPEALAESAH